MHLTGQVTERRRRAFAVSPLSRGTTSTRGTPRSAAARGPGGRGRALVLEIGGEQGIAAARSRSAIVARGRPSMTSAGRPSPSWASTLSVPRTPFASRRPTYASWFVPRPPPRTAIAVGAVHVEGPCAGRRRRRRAPPGHDVWTRSPCSRTIGTRTRSSACTHSYPYRPLSQSQPSFTGPESTPSRRTRRLDDDSHPARHCTAHVTHDVSEVVRSHGRAGESVRLRRERALRADLDRVAREVRRERAVGIRDDLGRGTPR